MFKSIVDGIIWMIFGLIICICLFLTSGCSGKIIEKDIHNNYYSTFANEEYEFITTLVAETIFNSQQMYWEEDRMILTGKHYSEENDEMTTIWLVFRENTQGDIFLMDVYSETNENIIVHPNDVKFLEDIVNKYLQIN